jgi:hypothetical protein
MTDTFRPGGKQTALLLALTVVAVGCALYLRYGVIQKAEIGIACASEPGTAFCTMRRTVMFLFENTVIGIVALVAGVLQLIRPNVALLGFGLVAAGFGIVLYNVVLSGLAVGLMILSLARPGPQRG